MSERLDDKDYKLIELLRRDSRTPISKLASELGLSESAVRKRLQKLISMGVIKRFTLEYEIEGEIKAIILVKTQPPTPVPNVSKRILENPSVEAVMEVTGEYDIVAIVKARDVKAVNEIIDYIRGIEGVAGTYTMIVLRSY